MLLLIILTKEQVLDCILHKPHGLILLCRYLNQFQVLKMECAPTLLDLSMFLFCYCTNPINLDSKTNWKKI